MTEKTTQERRRVTLVLNAETHRQLKVYAALNNTDVSNLIEKIANDFLFEEREAAYRPFYRTQEKNNAKV